ncbi:MAG: hypothetical protein ACRDZ0_00660 [Acidimicrobiales bacterium]
MQRTVSPNLETALEQITPTRAQWNAWASYESVLDGVTYGDLRFELRTGTGHRQDELLTALVHVVGIDPGAFNVIAACLLPGIRHEITRRAPSLERQDAMAIMVEALHEAVRRYNGDQPPRFVAAKLLALPTYRLRRAVAAHRAWRACASVTEAMALVSASELPANTLLGTAVDAGILAEHDARLIYETRIIGRPLRLVARHSGLGYEAAKKRRRRAEAAWVAWWAPERCDRRGQR